MPSSTAFSLLLLFASSLASAPDHATMPHRILTNPETGTLTYPLIPHSVHLARRRRQLAHVDIDTRLPPRPTQSRHSLPPDSPALRHARSLQQQMGALYQGYGTHYVDLWSETFRALGCDECMRGFCASMEGGKRCKISMSYAEGSSWTAYEGADVCYAGGPHDAALETSQFDHVEGDHIDPVQASQFAFELAFGCQTSITGLFITQLADGIMGMENDNTAFWKQMFSKKAIPKPEFSLCFWRQDNAEREGTGAGAMTLGGVDPRLHSSPMVYATNLKGSGFYAVHLKAVYLREGGGSSAKIEDMSKMHKLDVSESALNRGNVIVDSGTTDTYFTREIAAPFQRAWKDIMGNEYNHNAVTLTQEDIAALPTIIIVLEGHAGGVGDETDADPNEVPGYAGDILADVSPRDVVLAIPGSHYMEFDPDTGKYVARFYTDEGSGSVLGANAMMGHDIYFDTTNGRIGFAESDCDYTALLMQEGKSISVAPEEQTVSTKQEVPEETEALEPDGGDDNYTDDAGEELASERGDDGEYEDDGKYEDDQGEEEYEESYNEHEKGEDGSSTGGKGGFGSQYSDIATNLLEDMKHECSSASCRGVAAFLILAAALFVLIMVRRTIARRRVVRQYQEAELEISDLALDSDSDEDGGYEDEPSSLPRIS
eukprot:CCRYP_012138-RA/>CCRYP_012138-RA protein AED:0.11 eAED:0.11 QI:0/0/0/1/1/1/2/0/656